MQPIRLVVVFIHEEMYERFFIHNPSVNQHVLTGIDNRSGNRGLPTIYNEVIDQHQGENCWFFFCHEDLEIKSSLDAIEHLSPDCIYGTFGVNLKDHVPVAYGQHTCSNKDGSAATDVGQPVQEATNVQTLDCQSVLVHSSLLRQYPALRFDESLTFDLYVEDFCLNASQRHGINIKVFPLQLQHYSHGNITERYHAGLRRLAEKYPDVAVAGSCSFIGGRANELEKHFTYSIAAGDSRGHRFRHIPSGLLRISENLASTGRRYFRNFFIYIKNGDFTGLTTRILLRIGLVEEPPDPADSPFGEVYRQLVSAAESTEKVYIPLSDHALSQAMRVRAIAFYDPRFYPSPDNSYWQAEDSATWTNIAKAVPQFAGHDQPRLPAELGFYDQCFPRVLERQVELARQYGLGAFCFYYYWRSDTGRAFELPLEQYVNNENIDFPFCLCWVNESRTEHSNNTPDDDADFIADAVPLIADSRYMRVGDKPLLIVYQASLLTDGQRTAQTWRRYCRDHGLGEIWLVAAQTDDAADPVPPGFDAAVEAQPHNIRTRDLSAHIEPANRNFTGTVHLYDEAIRHHLAQPDPDYLLYPCVFPSWDNEACQPGHGKAFIGASPMVYRKWLSAVCDRVDQRRQPQDKLVFINAWNAWTEAAYLEPDRRFGYAHLEATQQTLAHYPIPRDSLHATAEQRLKQAQRRHDVAVVLHLFYPELWPELRQRLAVLEAGYDLYITYPETLDESVYAHVLKDVPDALLLPFPNHGRDIAPFLTVLPRLCELQYTHACKLHSKKTLHGTRGEAWRLSLLGQLLGQSRGYVNTICDAFKQDDTLGLIGPTGHWLNYADYSGFPLTRPPYLRGLARQLGIGEDIVNNLHFFAGSMFWFRPAALRHMSEYIQPCDFDMELGQIGGTLAHEVERLFAAMAQANGYHVTSTADPVNPPRVVPNYYYADPALPLDEEPWVWPGHATQNSDCVESIPGPKSRPVSAEPSVAILLCTYNGQKHLSEQMDSIAAQSHTNWAVWASDDGSGDNTMGILADYRNQWSAQHLSIDNGPGRGFAANFLSLSCHSAIEADYYAYADQDDVWEADKLARALRWLEAQPADVPALYCARTRYVDENGHAIGLSPLPSKPPGFANALMQNIGGGNTMIFNQAARTLLCEAGDNIPIVSHDWWAYLVVSGCGGVVHYDEQPSVSYRQHHNNLIGQDTGRALRLERVKTLLRGRFRGWTQTNIAAIKTLSHRLTVKNQAVLNDLVKARQAHLIKRLYYFKRSGIYRQGRLGNLELLTAVILRRI